MLEGFLYRLVSCEEGTALVQMLPESPIYAAHFPGYPVTPGVALLQMALELMDRPLKAASNIKFLIPVCPSADGPCLRFNWTLSGDSASVEILLAPEGALCARMSLELC